MQKNANSANIVFQYTEAFARHYPNAQLKITRAPAKQWGPGMHWVYIDGDKGSKPLSANDMQEAIAAFNH